MSRRITTPGPAVQRVLLAACQEQRNRRSKWSRALAVLLPLMLAAAFGLRLLELIGYFARPSPGVHLAGVLLVLPLAGAMATAWGCLVFSVFQQNHPQLAVTLPGQVPALRQALMLGSAALASMGGLLAAWFGGPVLLVVTGTSLFCAGSALAMRWPMLWLAALAPLWTLPLWTGHRAVIEWVVPLWLDWSGTVTLATVAVGALLLRAVVLRGGPVHHKAHARLHEILAAMNGQFTGADGHAAAAGMPAWYGHLGAQLLGAWMRRLLARPGSPPRARLALGLGPQAHWLGCLGGNALATLLALLVLLVSLLFPQWRAGEAVRVGVLMGLSMASIALIMQLPNALWASRREQVLLRLLPAAPQCGALNRWLALRLAGALLAVCLLQLAALLLVTRLSDINSLWPPATDMALATLALSPLLVPALWRDHSLLRGPTGLQSLQMLLVLLAFYGVAYAWTAMLGQPWWTLGLLALAMGLPLAAWRWQVLARLPPAWPAGRRAS